MSNKDFELLKEKYIEAKDTQKMLEVAENFLHVGSWVIDFEKSSIIVSAGWQKIHGINQSKLSLEDLMPIAHPEDEARITTAFESSMTNGMPYHLTHRIIHQTTSQVHTIKAYAEVLESDSEGKPKKMFGMVQDITEHKAAEDKLRFLATHDCLTGLPNRTLCMELLDSTIETARREGSQCAIMFLDLDQFKDVNDSYGHKIGDQILIETANKLKYTVRASDIVSRIGGDEFIIILKSISSKAEAETIAGKLVDKISEPTLTKNISIQVGCSIGISLFPFDSDEAERLIDLADKAMYKRKKAEKNGYQFIETEGKQDSSKPQIS